MRKLLTAFKNLPPEIRMLVAMAGLGTPIGLIYLMQRASRHLFGYTPSTLVLILCLAGVVAVLSLIGFVLGKIFKRGTAKRRKKMESELASGSEAGPVSMDLRAAIKSNNDKFFGAVRDMRKNIGISVYDLPWYIVIGDSGCGKTKLINEGGLVFSTGKPEGYQLGTLNYNWWFTEDAVFVDMAGRLCNPQDDADRREWMAFLDTIRKGRRGYPVNGALLCVSAEHLLQDSPEKQEQDANTALERLRDLQTKLGVTFATYLVVTKCDKILGFMQFFDRAGRDITIKNQIFGWSKPGNFNELYDPDAFDMDFDALSARLNELRLRRLSDDVDEIELGLAYSFPEEYRQLREPLHTYVRTLFPMIKNPRAVKNLIFRGIYFTSATQVGGVILKHLTERLGPEAADQFPPLESLYPQPRPHFVKDLLARKVIPEHGLVFRNEGQVLRNRKLSRLLKVGSSVLAVMVAAALGWSMWSFGNLIGTPREDARKAPTQIEAPPVALAGAEALGRGADRLAGRPWPARILSLGIGASQPIRDLRRMQVRLFEEGVLRPALLDVDEALRSAKLQDPRGGEPAVQAASIYLDALEQYLTWLGCRDQPAPPADVTFESLQKLCKLVPLAPDFYQQAGVYFSTIRETSGKWKNPARLLGDPRIDPQVTAREAILHARGYLAGFATLTADHPDPTIREWMRIRNLSNEITEDYETMLGTARHEINTQKDLGEFRDAFVAAYDKFAASLANCTWRGGGNPVRIGSLRDAILKQRSVWVDYQARLDQACRQCGSDPDSTVAATIASLTAGGGDSNAPPGLDLVLAKSLKDAELTQNSYMAGYFGESFPKLVSEVYEHYAHILAFAPHKEAFDSDLLSITPQARSAQAILKSIRDQLAAVDFEAEGDLSKEVPSAWIPRLERCLLGRAGAEDLPTIVPADELSEKWHPAELAALQAKYAAVIARGEGTRLLTTIAARMAQAREWGLAELYPGWREKTASVYQIPIPQASTPQEPGPSVPETPAEELRRPEQPTIRRPSEAPAPIRRPDEPSKPSVPKPVVMELEGLIPACATHQFLNDRAWDFVQLKIYLEQFTDGHFLPGEGQNRDLNEVCLARLAAAGQAYTDAYVQAWAKAYEQKRLPLLERLIRERGSSWNTLAEALSDKRSVADSDPRDIGQELRAALQEILQAVPWATCHPERGWWKNQTDKEWADVASWLQLSLRNQWPQRYGRFVAEAQPPDPDANPNILPWVVIAQAFDRGWMQVVEGIVGSVQLPREFNQNTKPRTEVPWSVIEQLRQRARLGDEKLTGQLVAFNGQAQSLLSAELTNILCDVQGRHLQNQGPYEGWPYVNPGGEQLTALETVPYVSFKDFLLEIAEAERVLLALEKGLPDDDPLKRKRQEFYRSCQAWRSFVGFDAQGQPADLSLDVRYVDPLDPTSPGGRVQGIDDTAQNYYREVHVYLGLTIQDPNQPGGVGETLPLKIGTLTRGEAGTRTAWWRWTSGGSESRLKMQLADGIQGEGKKKPYPDNIAPSILGTSSPLALCAYLHRYGRYDEQNGVWVSAHAIDLAAAFQAAGTADLIPPDGKTRIGAKFTFRLARAMPEPIRRLDRASPPAPPGEKPPA